MFDFINKKMSELSINGLLALGKYREALELIERTLEQEKDNVMLHNQKGICLKNLNDYKNAIYSFEETIKRNGNFREAYINLAECEKIEGEYKKSEIHYKKANSIKRLNRKDTLSYIKVLYELGKYYQAIEFITNNPFISLDIIDIELQKTKIDLYLKTDNPKKALEIIERLEPIIKNDITLDLYKADALLIQNNIEESAFIIEILRKKIPNSSYVKSLYSRLLIKQEKYEEALKIIKNSLKNNPNNEKLININIDLLIKLEQYKEALINLEGFSNLISKTKYLNYKSKIFLKMGNLDKAFEYSDKALKENISAITYVVNAEIIFEKFKSLKESNQSNSKDLENKLSTAVDNLKKAVNITKNKELLKKIYELKNNIEIYLK